MIKNINNKHLKTFYKNKFQKFIKKKNKFSIKKQNNLKLFGFLPEKIQTLEEHFIKFWKIFILLKTNIEKYIFLRRIQIHNETLFFYIIKKKLKEILPIIYTPTVGEVCKNFSKIFIDFKGLFISYPNRKNIKNILKNISKKNIKIIVVSDGERVLGLGDQGVGGIEISVGKTNLYSVFGGINPNYILPVILDVGTNNVKLLNNPSYLGWKNPRIIGKKYENFLEKIISSIKKYWPDIFIHFEDFSQKNATFLLEKYKNKICCFNDDIQGTSLVTVSVLNSAMKILKKNLEEENILIVGAGSAGCGIAKQIVLQNKIVKNIDKKYSYKKIYLVDKYGLLTENYHNILKNQKNFIKEKKIISKWNIKNKIPSLEEVMLNLKPTILIGVSGQKDIFNEKIIRIMKKNCKNPVIIILSNPISCMEIMPYNILDWTDGTAIFATGSPFLPIIWKGKKYSVPQCNNAYIFPGIGLGVIISNIKNIDDDILLKSTLILSKISSSINKKVLLPDIQFIPEISKKIALEILIMSLKKDNILDFSIKKIKKQIQKNFWIPKY